MCAERTRIDWGRASGIVGIFEKKCLSAACVCLMGVASAAAQVAGPLPTSAASSRLLSPEEGRSIVEVAWQQEQMEAGMRDCSHFVHQIYANAGFTYTYASSYEIYGGNGNFVRVKYPHPGDLIAWPGHVGIVVDPLQHSFYSVVRAGLQEQDYRSAYWRSRGIARFYRYRVRHEAMLTATRDSTPSRVSISRTERNTGTNAGPAIEEQTAGEDDSPDRPPAAVSERAEVIYGPPAPPPTTVSNEVDPPFAIPASVIISMNSKPPTAEDVAAAISKLSNESGRTLKTDDPLSVQLPVVIVEQFKVERIDIKRDHGSARLVVDSKVLIDRGEIKRKERHEKIRWELRRTESGWEAVRPKDRTYIAQDTAVKNLADQLAQVTKSDGAAQRQPAVLRQEAQLASLLNILLQQN
jgi:hypothetical protein